MAHLVEQGDPNPAGQLLSRIDGPTDGGEKERDAIGIGPCVVAPVRQRDALVQSEERTRWALVVDDDRHVLHLRTELVWDRCQRFGHQDLEGIDADGFHADYLASDRTPRVSGPSLSSATLPRVAKLHHVNLTIPVGGADDEAAFLVDIVGYAPVPAPDDVPTAKWFAFPDGTQIHLSEDPDHHPSARGHVALELGPDLHAVTQRLEAAGYQIFRFDGPNARVVFCEDPAGNRWELRDPTE